MTSFRLTRLLRLREETAKRAKETWAVEVRAAHQARHEVHDAEEARDQGVRALDAIQSETGLRDGAAMTRIIHGTEVVESLGVRVQVFEERAVERARIAAASQDAYEDAKKNVEALARLESKWQRDQRAKKRRREERRLDEFVSASMVPNRSISEVKPEQATKIADRRAEQR